MELTIDAFAAGHCGAVASYGCVLVATASDGRSMTHESSGILGKYTRNQADLIATIMALKCIKPEFQKSKITFLPPSIYVNNLLEKNDENDWLSQPTANVEQVDELRSLVDTFESFAIPKFRRDARIARCQDLAKLCQPKS